MTSRGGDTQSRRRILYIDHTAKLGGGEIALLHLVQYLDRARFEPVVALSSDGPLRGKLEAAGVETHILPLPPSVLETRKDSLGASTLLRLRDVARTGGYVRTLARFIRTHRIALVHTNSLKSDIVGGVAARLARTPLLWHIRDRIDDDYLPRPVVRVFRWLCRWLPQYLIANSQSTLETLSLSRQERAAAVYSGIDITSRITVVHDGVRRLPPRRPVVYAGPHAALLGPENEAAPPDGPVIGLVGRITRWKGQHVFLNAAAAVHRRFPDACFQIIGAALFDEQAYEEEIRALTRSLGLEKYVDFLGFRSDVPELIAGMDILVHASVTAEPFGQVIVEGMVAQKPVVATNGGGAKEIVLNGETGLLVPMGDADAMADAILFLLENPEAAAQMGERGYQRACDFFSIERTARAIENVYDAMLR